MAGPAFSRRIRALYFRWVPVRAAGALESVALGPVVGHPAPHTRPSFPMRPRKGAYAHKSPPRPLYRPPGRMRPSHPAGGVVSRGVDRQQQTSMMPPPPPSWPTVLWAMKHNQPIALWQLDRRLAALGGRIGQRPPEGWVRTLREALGLTCAELGLLVHVSGVRIFQIEHEELDGSLQLRTLERVATGLNCRFFYVLVPETPLESMDLKRKVAVTRPNSRPSGPGCAA